MSLVNCLAIFGGMSLIIDLLGIIIIICSIKNALNIDDYIE